MEKNTEIEVEAYKKMALIVKAEELAMTAITIYLLTIFNPGLPVWIWVLLFFSPDISIIAYLIGPGVGAFIYNVFHHRAVAVILAAAGLLFHNDIAIASGILLFSHSSFDRMMGYGLKFTDDFKHTSLGWIGNSKLN